MDITKKWIGQQQDWIMMHAQRGIYFAEQMPESECQGVNKQLRCP